MPSLLAQARQARASGGFDRYVARTDRALLLLAVAFVALLLLPVLEPDLPGPARTALAIGNGVVWLVFALDYVIRLYLAPARGSFVRRNLLDLAIIALPMLRPLRLLRGARALRAVRVVRLFGLANQAADRGRRSLVGRVTAYASVIVSLGIATSAVAVLELERGHDDANITSLGEAFWWASTTVTTVGYGDRFPVTAGGRLVAVVLMLGGIAMLGVVTAAVAASFVRHVTADDRAADIGAEDAAAAERSEQILAALEQLSARLDRLEQRSRD